MAAAVVVEAEMDYTVHNTCGHYARTSQTWRIEVEKKATVGDLYEKSETGQLIVKHLNSFKGWGT